MSWQITLSLVLDLIAKMSGFPGFAVPPSEDGGFPGITWEQYADSLRGPRQGGSLSSFGLEDLDRGLVLTKYEHPLVQAGTRAYKAGIPEGFKAFLGAVAENKVPAGLKVEERDGRHGPEKFVDRSPEEALTAGDMPPTDYFIVMITDAEVNGLPQKVVATWHPGDPEVPENAVKLHNG